MLQHECPHIFRGLRGGESLEEEFQVGLGFDLIGLGSFALGKRAWRWRQRPWGRRERQFSAHVQMGRMINAESGRWDLIGLGQ